VAAVTTTRSAVRPAGTQYTKGNTMTEEEIRVELAAILHEVAEIDPAEVQTDKSFVEDLDVDSLLMTEIVVAVEERFEVRIEDESANHIRTVGDLVNHLHGMLVAV
jgi:acyl carrier protein